LVDTAQKLINESPVAGFARSDEEKITLGYVFLKSIDTTVVTISIYGDQ
jgi:hypothetical protein